MTDGSCSTEAGNVNEIQLAVLAVANITVQPESDQLPRSMRSVQADPETQTHETLPDTRLPQEANPRFLATNLTTRQASAQPPTSAIAHFQR
jgi:hypothetical protein